MDTEKFNDLLTKYKKGNLSKEEENLFESELDKYESYQDFLDDKTKNDIKKTDSNYPNNEHMRSLNRSKRKAIISNALMAMALFLMILPICTIFSFIYYGYGISDSRGNNFIQVAADTISITEPNTTVDFQNISVSVGLLSMQGQFDVYKQIGNSQEYLRTDDLTLFLNKVDQPRRLRNPNNPKFSHPNNKSITTNNVNQYLHNLSDGTVSEIYISLDTFYSEEEIEDLFRDIDLEILWYAVNTGTENNSNHTPIGYPAMDSDINSSFNSKEDNNKQFIKVLNFLNKYQNWTEMITKNSSLNINETTKFIDKNGIEIYGVVVTGPTKELLKIKDIPAVTNQDLGGVELWNWQ